MPPQLRAAPGSAAAGEAMRTSNATANSLCDFDMKMSSADWETASRPGQAGDRACEIPPLDLTLFLPGATALSPDLGAQKKDGGFRRRLGPDDCRRGVAATASALRRVRSCSPPALPHAGK